jgi:uncharacterized protein
MSPISRCLLLGLLLLVNLATLVCSEHIEPRTGIAFEDNIKRTPLVKLGLRSKGPIKVYAVGQYGKHIFMLKMSYNVNAEKLSDALMEAIKPRCKTLGCSDQVDAFKEFVTGALPNGAKAGTTLVFNTGGGKVTLSVNDKPPVKIVGKTLAQAFAGIYTDANAVVKMKNIETKDNFRTDSETMATLGVMAATTLAIILVVTKPDASIKITQLNIYPVKSCAEQSVPEATVTPKGFQGDRIAMVVDQDGKCCTSRDKDQAKLFHVHPEIDPQAETMTLTTAAAVFYPLEVDLTKSAPTTQKIVHNEAPGELQLVDYGNVAASWLETATGITGCRLTGIGDEYKRKVLVNESQGTPLPLSDAPVSLADEAPFLLCNEASLEDLNRRLRARGEKEIDMRRFRPNLVISSSAGLAAWEEDTWSKIKIGSVEFFVWQRCGRCIMTTIDRDSLKRSGEPLATLNTFRESDKGQRNFGMHLIPDPQSLQGEDGEAVIRVGDKIEVLEYNEERLKEWQENKEDGGME